MRIRTIIMALFIAAAIAVGHNVYTASTQGVNAMQRDQETRKAQQLNLGKERMDRATAQNARNHQEVVDSWNQPAQNNTTPARSNPAPAAPPATPRPPNEPVPGNNPAGETGTVGVEPGASADPATNDPVTAPTPPPFRGSDDPVSQLQSHIDRNIAAAPEEWQTWRARRLGAVLENWEGYYEQAVNDYDAMEERYQYVTETSREYFLLRQQVVNSITDPELRQHAEQTGAISRDQYFRWQKDAGLQVQKAAHIMAKLHNLDRLINIERADAELDSFIKRETINVPPILVITEERIDEFLRDIGAGDLIDAE